MGNMGLDSLRELPYVYWSALTSLLANKHRSGVTAMFIPQWDPLCSVVQFVRMYSLGEVLQLTLRKKKRISNFRGTRMGDKH